MKEQITQRIEAIQKSIQELHELGKGESWPIEVWENITDIKRESNKILKDIESL